MFKKGASKKHLWSSLPRVKNLILAGVDEYPEYSNKSSKDYNCKLKRHFFSTRYYTCYEIVSQPMIEMGGKISNISSPIPNR